MPKPQPSLSIKLTWRPYVVFYGGMVLLAVLVGILAFTLIDSRHAARRQAEQAAANITLALERDILRSVGALDRSVRSAARAATIPGLDTMDPSIRAALLFDGAVASVGATGAFVTDEAGQVIHDSLGVIPRDVNIADRAYFQAHRDHPNLGLVLSQPLHNRSNGKWSIALSRRISRPDGSFAGVAVAGLPISFFGTLFSGLDVGEQGILNLVTTDQRRLVARRPDRDQDIGRGMGDSVVFTHLANSPAGRFESRSSIDGHTRLYSYRKVGDLPLVVAVGLATEEIYAEWRRKALIVCGIILTLVACEIGLAWALRRELRLRALAEADARDSAAAARQGEADLARAMAPIDTLFNSSADAMLVLRAEPDGNFVYETVNPIWERMNGVSAEAAIGRRPGEVLAPEVATGALAGMRACVESCRPTRYCLCVPAGSGREWEVMMFPILLPEGAVDRLIVVAREITERNRLEADLRQAQKMEVVGRLAAGVSHDFNNILQVIGGGVENLRDETTLSATASDFLDIIDRASRRGAYLTHHLLAYSRKQALTPKLLDLRELLDNLVAVLSRTLGTDITISAMHDPAVGTVLADRGQLETALMNLAINAADAMPNGGILRFEISGTSAAPFGDLTPGRHVVLAVTDSGTGIAPEILDRIFDPFFTTKGVHGTGLGLAMVHGFSRQSGGDVRAISAPGQGTRFEIWLPEVAMPAAPEKPVAAELVRDGAGRVLVVDDAPDVLIMLTAFLRAAGFTAREAVGGKEALALLQAGERFDLLVTDYQMPSMKGPELISRARLLQPGLPSIVVSGFADVDGFMADLPDVVLLRKPFQRRQFIAEVSLLVTQARPGAPAKGAARLDRVAAHGG